MKEDSKSNKIATNSQVGFEKTVLDFITKSRDYFPKLYNKLKDIYKRVIRNSTYVEQGYLHIDDYNIPLITNIDSGKQLINKFLKKVNKRTIQANSNLADDVMINMLQKLEKDFDMEPEDEILGSPCLHDAPLAITD